MYRIIYCLFIILLFLFGCRTEIVNGPKPVISWEMSGVRFSVFTDEVLTIVPNVAHTDETTTYQWFQNEELVGTDDHYTFCSENKGVFYIRIKVTNRFGFDEDEVKVTVEEKEETLIDSVPENDSVFRWKFPFNEINIPVGTDLKITPYIIENANNGKWSWSINGEKTENDKEFLIFRGDEEGDVKVQASLIGDSIKETKNIIIHVCPKAGTFKRTQKGERDVNRIYEYMPAPGHQVNGFILTNKDRLSFPADCTHEAACDSVLLFFKRGWSISLGGCGGYVIAGFDHSIIRKESGNELSIKGNPYDYQSEPGIIWVSQDVNGDGIPNDIWYELAGSEYATENHIQEYAITYYHPSRAHSATVWKDNKDRDGYVPYMSYWNKEDFYWVPWIARTEHTYYGTALKSRHTYIDGISLIPAYDWGYADNLGSDYNTSAGTGHYSISNARTWNGKEADLEFIDFVRIQTAQTGWTPNLGEISTEVYHIRSNE